MKRTRYLLKDEVGTVQARWILPEEETPALDPWMRHNVRTKGWRLEAWEDNRDSGVQIHGWADWQGVADNLAACVRIFLSDEGPETEEEVEQFYEQCRAALDDYAVAQMEVSVASADAEPEDEEKTDGD